LIADTLDARAESAQGFTSRDVRRYASCDEVVDARRDERLELFIDVGVDRAPTSQWEAK
jgi:hypothetical protein